MDPSGSAFDSLRALRNLIGTSQLLACVCSGFATVMVYSVREVDKNIA